MLVSKKDLPLQYGKVGKKPPFCYYSIPSILFHISGIIQIGLLYIIRYREVLFSFLPMNDPKAGVFSWIPGVYGWKAGVFCLKSNEYQNRSSSGSFLILVGIDYTYIWFSFIPFTHLFICLIFCLFLWRVWRCRSFGLTPKNQKLKIVFVLFSWKKRTKSSRLTLRRLRSWSLR